MNPFRQPTESEEDFEENIRLDRIEFERNNNPFPLIQCKCGHSYTLETNTVCPKCFLFPPAELPA